ERAEDAPRQHGPLVGVRDVQAAEDDEEHEQVVEAEALLDEVGREVLLRGGAADPPPDEEREREADADPDAAPHDGGGARARPRAPVHGEIDDQEPEQDAAEHDPGPGFEASQRCLRKDAPRCSTLASAWPGAGAVRASGGGMREPRDGGGDGAWGARAAVREARPRGAATPGARAAPTR